MKKLLLLFFFSIFFLNTKAQTSVYHPFPDSGAVWGMHTTGCCYANCSQPITNPVLNENYFSYFINGDTIINATTYHKIYTSGIYHEHCLYGSEVDNRGQYNNVFVCGFRQDTSARKVFVWEFSQESLLYDFNLKVGDSLEGCTRVISIDSILIGNNYRKKFTLSVGYFLIEGIGKTSGLLNNDPLCPFEFQSELLCFSQKGKTLFPDTTSRCDNVTQVRNMKEELSVLLFPNPASNKITISNYPFSNKEVRVEIYNMMGELVSRESLAGSSGRGTTPNSQLTTEIDVSSFAAGVYLVQVGDGEKSYRSKFVKSSDE